MSVRERLLLALPWVLGLAFLGAGLGMLFGDPRNGFRIGAVIGGVGAFLHIQRRVQRTG